LIKRALLVTNRCKICLAYSVTNVSDLNESVLALWPMAGREEWDRPGLMLGSPSAAVTRVLLSVDVTAAVISEAAERGCQALLCHHPMFLRGVTELGESTAKGSLTALAIRQNLAVIAAHTNADFVADGVTETLARAIGLSEMEPLVVANQSGRVGAIASTSVLEFARLLGRVLPATASGIRVSGDPEKLVGRVAVVAGSGDSLIQAAFDAGADAFVTSDLRHHPVQDAAERAIAAGRDFAIIDISHWGAESLWLDVASGQLALSLPNVEFLVSELRTDPWDFAVMQ
jgi:dinuclear metal center YbgI/SA1388 family protein